MGLDFKLKDFAHPFAILKLKHVFKRNQWLSQDMLFDYQRMKLKYIIELAYAHVPYYRKIFKERGIIPSDIKTPQDLKILPFLDKNTLRSSFEELKADNCTKFQPRTLTTSGTTGGAVKFYMDKPANVLEFVYYWRLWGWAGYRLGDTFAELSAQSFTPYNKRSRDFYIFESLTRRLMMNSLLISTRNAEEYRRIFRKFKPAFIKGLPSNLFMLALMFSKHQDHGVTFKGIFSQGENLLAHQRVFIEKVFQAKIFDSYGHMERTAAIAQCSSGSYHVHSDYGIAEFIPSLVNNIRENNDDQFVAEIVGSSLYNFSMPLIRYRTGDYALLSRKAMECSCGRKFPTVVSILGRGADVVLTSDRRAITALYVALDRTPGLVFGQIVQESLNKLIVHVAYEDENYGSRDVSLLKNIRDFVGDDMHIDICHIQDNLLGKISQEKFKVIVSRLTPEDSFLN